LDVVKGLYPDDFSSITAGYEMITMATPALSSRNDKWRVSDHRRRICFEVGVYTLKHPESKGIKVY
jgi:hypothetical protein